MTKAMCCIVLFAVTVVAQAQSACSYFSNANNCSPAAPANNDSATSSAISAATKNANTQAIVQQQSIFTQKNANPDDDGNTQKKLYSAQPVNLLQDTTPQKKSGGSQNGTQQNGSSQFSSGATANGVSRQTSSTLLTTNGNGQPSMPGMITNGNITNNGILKLSSQNLTSNTNSLATGAPNSLSNGSVINSIAAPSNSLSSSTVGKAHNRSADLDSSDTTPRGMARPTINTYSKSNPGSKSKSSSESKPKDPANCIFVGLQQVCG